MVHRGKQKYNCNVLNMRFRFVGRFIMIQLQWRCIVSQRTMQIIKTCLVLRTVSWTKSDKYMGFKILQHDKYIFFTILYAYIQLYFYILLYNYVTFLIIIEQISVLQITAWVMRYFQYTFPINAQDIFRHRNKSWII